MYNFADVTANISKNVHANLVNYTKMYTIH